MSIAERAAWADSMLFMVDVLPRFAVMSTAVSASATIAITVRVTISSTIVKPRGEGPNAGPGSCEFETRSMSSPPHVGNGRDRAQIRVVPLHGHGDLSQVVERRGQGGDIVVALPTSGGSQHLVRSSGGMPPVRERGIRPSEDLQVLDFLLGVSARLGQQLVRDLAVRGGRDEPAERQNARGHHDDRDQHLDQRDAAFGALARDSAIHGDPYCNSTSPESWTSIVSARPPSVCRITMPERSARPSAFIVTICPVHVPALHT